MRVPLLVLCVTLIVMVAKCQSAQPDAEMLAKNPFRMAKINAVWDKARKRLSQEKLKVLFSELKIQDKEELTWKRLKADGSDKDGLKEAELRRKLSSMMHRYGLAEHFDFVDKPKKKTEAPQRHNEATDKETQDQQIFKDKKLNKLWQKASMSGFTEDELKTLKEELQHHQEKIEEYYSLLESLSSGDKNEMSNDISDMLSTNHSKYMGDPQQHLKEKHRELKNGYDRLSRMAVFGPEDKAFEDHQTRSLWELAQKADFTQHELESLKEELQHFEHRVRKLRHLESQVDLVEASHKDQGDDTLEARKRMEQKLKHYSQKVNKIHSEIESRIMQRHLEL